ncbi:MAG: FAD:protein FMN transferase [Marinibacterium sp.]|nr:FAD:protein FMN transferase [Marinibacterium sp.]
MPLALAACYNRQNIIEVNGVSMGTTYNIVAVDHDNLIEKAEVQQAVSRALTEVNQAMSNWDAGSEISRINAMPAHVPAAVSAPLAEVMQAAADVNLASEGRFDTTMGPLIELWGFGAPGERAMPGDDAIAAAQARSGHDNTLMLGAGHVQKVRSDAQVYLAGIGKGYGADHVGRALETLGLTDYMVEIGGDLYASGRNPDGLAWQIGIESPNPLDHAMLGVVGVSGRGLASSGDYRNYFEADGQRYSHLIDPATGRPVAHKTASATVLADNAMLADAWSTAMLILGREHGLEIAARHDIAVQFVDRDQTAGFTTYASPAFEALRA